MTETTRPTILIIDDDRLNRAVLAELLHDEGRLLMAKDGPSGLKILEREEDVALVLLDVSMPMMDGYEVLKRIRSNPVLADTAVIFITGMSDEADEERGLLMGAADYVQKPVRPAIVRARVKTHLKLVLQRRSLEQQALQDGLTGIANRRYFDEMLESSVRHSIRNQAPLSLAILDVDHFKQYNDHYGHGAGDEALKAVASTLHHFTRRPGDLVARYGGEEFVLLLSSPSDLATHLETIRHAVEAQHIEHAKSSTSGVLTISGGGICAIASAALNGARLLKMADQLLYTAKQQGRNRMQVENHQGTVIQDNSQSLPDTAPHPR